MTNTQPVSATIYQFPARGRFAANGSRGNAQSSNSLNAPRLAMTACGSSWYHEDAIREDANSED